MANATLDRTIAILLVTAALSACGGGGGGGSSSTSTPTPTPPPSTAVTLSTSNGDMSKYLGRWVSNCGFVLASASSIVNSFDLTTISGSSISGTLTVTSYASSITCSGTSTQSALPVSVTFVGSTAVVSTGAPDFIGTADRVSLSGVQTVLGFRDTFSKFIIANTSNVFSTANLTYTKQ